MSVAKFSPLPNCPANTTPQLSVIVLSAQTAFALMSHSRATASESSSNFRANFQLILDNALKDYKKRTKKDLLVHPLASQLQACESPGDILAVLQQQIQGLDQSRSADERWTKWLDSTINILLTFSQTVGTVGLVLHALIRICTLIFILQAFSPATVIFAGIGVLLSVCILDNFACDGVTHTFFRRRRVFEQVKRLLWTSLNAWRCFSDGSRCTRKCRRPQK